MNPEPAIIFQLSLNPSHQQVNNALLFALGKFSSDRDVIPLIQAPAAATCTGMLRDEYRMAAHWRLLAVIRNICRCKAHPDKVCCMPADGIHAFICDILSVLIRQVKSRTKCRFLQTYEGLLYGCHYV